MDELVESLESVERPVVIKALGTWIDLGVIKETDPDTFRLLKVAEDTGPPKTNQRAQGS